MKKVIKTAVTLGLSVLPLLGASPVFAGTTDTFDLRPVGNFSALTNITFPQMVRSLTVLAMVIASIVAFAFLIYGGIVWITSGGDKSKTEAARNTITAALVGLLIVFGAWAIIQLLEMFFGVSILDLQLSPFGAQS